MQATVGKHSRRATVLVAESFAPTRIHLAHALRKLGYRVIEAVDAKDAAFEAARELPDSCVVSSRLEREGDSAIVQELAAMDVSASRPTVLVLDDDRCPSMENGAPQLPKNVFPVARTARSGKDFVYAVLEAHVAARAAFAGVVQVPEKRQANVKDLEHAAALDHAFDSLGDVVRRVEKGDLPGPMLPTLLTEVRSLFADTNVRFGSIAALVRRHPMLALRVLALANSAFYRGKGERYSSTGIEAAIARLGMVPTASLLHAIAALAFIVGKNDRLRTMIRENLRRAYATAMFAREFARVAGHANPDAVYTVALLHNIGPTFFLYALALIEEEEGDLANALDHDAVATVMNNRAGALNALVANRTGLPVVLRSIWESPNDRARSREDRDTIALVHRGIWAAVQLETGKSRFELDVDAAVLGIDAQALEAINAKLADIAELVDNYASVSDATAN